MTPCESCATPTQGKLCDPCFDVQPVTPEGHTIAQLRASFEDVAHPDDWKMAICCAVESDADTVLISRAIAFFTGSVATFQATLGGIQVQAAGYRVAMGE